MPRTVRLIPSLVLSALLVGCGGSTPPGSLTGVSDVGAARVAEVGAAAAAGATAFGAEDRCARVLTPRLVQRIYGSASRCRRIVPAQTASPDDNAQVLRVKIAGRSADARVSARDGDGGTTKFGTLRLRYSAAGGWQVDGFDSGFLRAGLGSAVAGAMQSIDELEKSEIRACIARGFRDTSNATVVRAAYGVLGQRRDELLSAYRRLIACRADDTSLLRRVFERELREDVLDGQPTTQRGCITRGLRLTRADTRVAAIVAAGNLADRGLAGLVPSLLAVFRACSVPALHLSTTSPHSD